MNDFIEIFEEFDKKFIKLLKDILVKPGEVFNSLSLDASPYMKPFRFFSYISSTVLLIIILLNRFEFVGFWSEEYWLPLYWQEYYQSLSEVELTLFPITGFFFIIGISTILTFLLFRKPEHPFKHYLHYTLYISGFVLIYYLPAIGLSVVITDAMPSSGITEMMLYLLLIILPGVYFIRSHWFLGGNKILRPIKSTAIIVLTGYIFSSFYYNLQLERIVNDNFFYRKDRIITSGSTSHPTEKVRLFTDNDSLYLFPSTHADDQKYILGIANFNSDKIELYALEDTLKKVSELSSNNIVDINPYRVNNQVFALTHSHTEDGIINQFWKISPKDPELIFEDSILISPLSSVITLRGDVFISGINKKHQATLYEVEQESISPLINLEDENSNFDFLLEVNDSTLVTIVSKTAGSNLSEISINRINMDSKEVEVRMLLFENRIAKVPAFIDYNYRKSKVYNPWVAKSVDGKNIFVAFQLMTEKTFELHVFKLDLELNIIDKTYFTTDGHLSYFYSYGLDENGIYAFGREFRLVSPNFSEGNKSSPFLTRFNASDLSKTKTEYFDPLINWSGLGLESQLYMYEAKLNVLEKTIELLWINEESIDKVTLPKF